MSVIFQLHGVGFEWDEEKYAVNLRKHGVKFEDAAEVFFDPLGVYEDASVDEEQRESITGFSFSSKVLYVIFIERDVWTRIISARPATLQERNEYARKNFGK